MALRIARGLFVLSLVVGCSSAGDPTDVVEDAESEDSSTSTDDTGTAPGDTGTSPDTEVDSTTDADASTCGAKDTSCAKEGECCSGLHCVYGKCTTCSPSYPDFCAVPGRSYGGCFPAGTACSTVVECSGGTARGCPSADMKYDCTTKLCSCTDPTHATFCTGHDTVPTSCWSTGTACSTTTKCADGTLHSCLETSDLAFDCTTKTCKCKDAAYPVYCKSHDAVPTRCWSPQTSCNTTKVCPDGTLHACRSSVFSYDCTTKKCTCGDPSYPVYCPALGDVPENCWSAGTICGSVANCSGTYHSCKSAGYHYDCSKGTCVPDSTGGTGGSTSCDPSSCKSFSDCVPGYGCMTCFQYCEGSVCHDGGCSDPF